VDIQSAEIRISYRSALEQRNGHDAPRRRYAEMQARPPFDEREIAPRKKKKKRVKTEMRDSLYRYNERGRLRRS
jgi:hypothetical protein